MRNQRRYSGQSLVEVALVLPLAFFLITGFLDLGRVVFYYSSLTNAVREATRYAIVHKDEINAAYNNPTDNSLQEKVMEYAIGLSGIPDPLTKDDISVITEISDNLFRTVSIEVVYQYKPVTPGIQVLFGSTEGFNLYVQSKMHVTPGSM
ncbi:MAG TPA: TadE family protein [Desulfosporosinus sp.]|nr:TadE family protein [Desulfosporosinus sp.]